MGKINLAALLMVIVGLGMFTGCSSASKKDVRALQAQIGAITEELVRLDESLQEVHGSLQVAQTGGGARTGGSAVGGIYRTPSGFELPALQIQQALQNAGYYRGSLDGKIGPDTRSAIEAFQRDQGLEVDGIVGRGTWAKLKVYLNPVK